MSAFVRTASGAPKPLLVAGLLAVVWGAVSARGIPGLAPAAGLGLGAAQGALWTLCAALAAVPLSRLRARGGRAADTSALLATLGAAVLFGPGLYSALTYPTPEAYLDLMLSEDPGAAYTYFMVLNPLMEWVAVPVALLLNWPWPRRRRLLLAGAATYYLVRAWTAFYFAPVTYEWQDSAGEAPTQAQIDQAGTWMTLDWLRIGLDLVVCVAFACATLLSRARYGNGVTAPGPYGPPPPAAPWPVAPGGGHDTHRAAPPRRRRRPGAGDQGGV